MIKKYLKKHVDFAALRYNLRAAFVTILFYAPIWSLMTWGIEVLWGYMIEFYEFITYTPLVIGAIGCTTIVPFILFCNGWHIPVAHYRKVLR